MRLWVALLGVGVWALSLPALAAEPRPPGHYVHDGFYAQLALGAGMIRDSFESGDGNFFFDDTRGTVKGFGHSQHFAIGGAIAPGLALAGAAAGDIARTTSTDFEGGRVSPEESYAVLTLGPMLDFYFDPRGGLHALAGGGLGVTSPVQPDGVDGGGTTGFGVFAGVGYEWWIAPQWGIGALLRVQYVRAEESVTTLIVDTYKVDHSAVGTALMFSATYN